uniref:Reverse transcriptase domain-containing protein n=1 Tax=Trichogramma kaykai TaxID=54128 RepID=A0ABD2W5R8_9HYME
MCKWCSEIMAYADDLLLIVTGGSWQTCENQGQDMTSLIARWVDCLCLEINRAKTEMILLKNSATSGKKVTKAAGKRILGEKRVMEKKNQTGSLIRKGKGGKGFALLVLELATARRVFTARRKLDTLA